MTLSCSAMILASLGSAVLGWLMFFLSLFLILLVLVQRGKGGGLTGALGGPGGQSAFGSKAGDTFTLITAVSAIIWGTVCAVAMYTLGVPPLTAEELEADIEPPPALTAPEDEAGEEAAEGLSGLSGLLSEEPGTGEPGAGESDMGAPQSGEQTDLVPAIPPAEQATEESDADADNTTAEDAAANDPSASGDGEASAGDQTDGQDS